jgi:hypothetical protein
VPSIQRSNFYKQNVYDPSDNKIGAGTAGIIAPRQWSMARHMAHHTPGVCKPSWALRNDLGLLASLAHTGMTPGL